jgi:ATPase family associated with various cellular activities (AAA)
MRIAAMKVAVALDELPQMLRSIVLEALRREPDMELVGHTGPGAAEVLISGPQRDAAAAILAHGVTRLVEIDGDGRRAVVHTLRHERTLVDDPSPSRLVALLRHTRGAGKSEPGCGLLGRVFGLPRPARGTAAAASPVSTVAPARAPAPHPPEGVQPAPAPLARELARLALHLLAARQPLPASGASELVAFARQLADAAAVSDARPPGLLHAARCFGLREDECELLLMAALVEVDPRAARLMSLVNDHMGKLRPTVGLVRELGGDLSAVVERLTTDGPLLRLRLVALEGDGPVASRAVKVDDAVWPLLLGLQRRDPFERLVLRPDGLEGQALPEACVAACRAAADAAARRHASELLLMLAGDAGVGRRSMAEAIAGALRTSALVVEGAAIADEVVVAALSREAIWTHAIVIVTRAEEVPTAMWRVLTQRLEAPLIATAARGALAGLAAKSARAPIEVQAPRRDAEHRLRLWRSRAPPAWPLQALRDLAERYDFGGRQIDAALAAAAARASPAGAAGPQDVRAACEMLRETRFAGAAARVECPFEAGDIVLRDETRREIDLATAWARHAASVFGAGGPGAALRAGGGLICLFSGPPGGGKTMAAQIMAREIDYALFRIDLSQVVDKFIGESEKKLAALFDEAERARVALFFDEADALFGKRTELRDSHDRYANITVDYLLQRIEAFDGLAILATNFATNIDDAFLRRIRVRAVFPAPDAGQRRRIWDKLLPAADRAADIDLALLSDRFELMGGEIRNAIYSAHLFAAREGVGLSMRHCVLGLWRELGKTGRITSVSQLGRWKDVVAQ